MNKEKTLAVYFTNGGVAYFENVKEFEVNEVGINFKYSGVSSGVNREALFLNVNIAGFALEIDEESDEGINAETK